MSSKKKIATGIDRIDITMLLLVVTKKSILLEVFVLDGAFFTSIYLCLAGAKRRTRWDGNERGGGEGGRESWTGDAVLGGT